MLSRKLSRLLELRLLSLWLQDVSLTRERPQLLTGVGVCHSYVFLVALLFMCSKWVVRRVEVLLVGTLMCSRSLTFSASR